MNSQSEKCCVSRISSAWGQESTGRRSAAAAGPCRRRTTMDSSGLSSERYSSAERQAVDDRQRQRAGQHHAHCSAAGGSSRSASRRSRATTSATGSMRFRCPARARSTRQARKAVSRDEHDAGVVRGRRNLARLVRDAGAARASAGRPAGMPDRNCCIARISSMSPLARRETPRAS